MCNLLMNYIDTINIVFKYIKNINSRHVSFKENIGCIGLLTDYINKENSNIINKYKQYLNKKDTNVITRCIWYNINIVPILYQSTNDDIDILICEAIESVNINMLININNYIKIDSERMMEHLDQWTGRYININLIKFIHKILGVSKDCLKNYNLWSKCNAYVVETFRYFHKNIGFNITDFNFNEKTMLLENMCGYNNLHTIKYLHKNANLSRTYLMSIIDGIRKYECHGNYIHMIKYFYEHMKCQKDDFVLMHLNACSLNNLNIVEYLHKIVGFNKIDFQMRNNGALHTAVSKGHIDIIKYLHKNLGFTKEEFINCHAYELACKNNKVETIQYLHKEIGLTKEDFQLDNSICCVRACNNGNFNIVEYLHQEVGLTKEDFQLSNNAVCYYSCSKGYIDIVEYLHKKIGLTKENFQANNNSACISATINSHLDVIEYLHKKIGLTKEDFRTNNNEALICVCLNSYLDIVEYLHKEIGLSKEDFEVNDNQIYRDACENDYIFSDYDTKIPDLIKYLLEEVNIGIN